MKISDMTVGTRLGGGFSILIVLALAIALIGAWRLRGIDCAVAAMVGDVIYKERLFCIEQINLAITNMDEVTQQNAALVEPAAAAGSMQEQASHLADLVSLFKLEQTATRRPAIGRSRPSLTV